MSLELRAAEIRAWTQPGRPVPLEKVASYAALAATWQQYRLKVHKDSLPADAERFLTLTTALRKHVAVLGLKGLILGPVLMAVAIAVLRLWADEARARRPPTGSAA